MLPGAANAEDEGCVSCHVDGLSLNVVLGNVQGHPNISAMMKTIPTDCVMCHAKGTPKALSVILHKAHLMTCTFCHSMNPETGEAGLKSGAKNWE